MAANAGKALFVCLVLTASLACNARAQHSVTVTWQAPGTASGISVVGYNVYRKTTEDSTFSKIASRVASPPYEDRAVKSGKTYFYAVTAVDKLGRESRLSENIQAKIP